MAKTAFTPRNPCPICGGHKLMPHGQGRRCYGYTYNDGYARCTREDHAGPIPQNADGTYSHIDGRCNCGNTHALARPSEGEPRREFGRRHWRHTDAATGESFRHYRTDYDNGEKEMPWDVGAHTRRMLYMDHFSPATQGPVVIVEGETSTEAVAAVAPGLVVGTVCGAPSVPEVVALEVLRGRPVILWADKDDKGLTQMQGIAKLLTSMDCTLSWVHPPADAPEGWDAADAPSGVIERLLAAAQPEAPSISFQDEEAEGISFNAVPPYPLEALPNALHLLVRDVSATGLPAALAAGAGLAALAAAIGPCSSISLQGGWRERAIIWVALMAPRGGGKSPCQRIAFAPLRDYDAQTLLAYATALKQWQALPSAARGDPPADESILIADATLESLFRRLGQSPGGALDVDELSLLLRGMGEYKSGASGDRSRFLMLWTGDNYRYTRVGNSGGARNGTDIPIIDPTLVVCGGLQTSIHPLLGDEEDGMRPRWLPHIAPYEAVEPSGSASAPREWLSLLGGQLLPARNRFREWTLSPPAYDRFHAYRQLWRRRSRLAAPSLEAALVKADTHLLRMTLILAEAESPASGGEVDGDLVDRAASLIEFTLGCWGSLLEGVSLAKEISRRDAALDGAADRIYEWVFSRGGMATAREILRNNVAGIRTIEQRDQALAYFRQVHPGAVTEQRVGGGAGRNSTVIDLRPLLDRSVKQWPTPPGSPVTDKTPPDKSPPPARHIPDNSLLAGPKVGEVAPGTPRWGDRGQLTGKVHRNDTSRSPTTKSNSKPAPVVTESVTRQKPYCRANDGLSTGKVSDTIQAPDGQKRVFPHVCASACSLNAGAHPCEADCRWNFTEADGPVETDDAEPGADPAGWELFVLPGGLDDGDPEEGFNILGDMDRPEEEDQGSSG